MGNPLKDQLLKAGLATKKQARKAEHEQRLSRQQNKGKSPAEVVNQAKLEQQAHEKRNRELNQQREEEKRQRERKAQVKQLIEQNRLPKDDGGEPYNFVEQNKIKRIFVSDEMADQLSHGLLAIAKLGNTYEVVPAKVARQIADRDQEALLVFHEESGEQIKNP